MAAWSSARQKRCRPTALVGIAGRLAVDGKPVGEGKAEDPYATLAWLANHLAERGRDLKAGMVVITGSLIPTVSIGPGERAVFTVEGLGEAVMEAVEERVRHGDPFLSTAPLARASSVPHLAVSSAPRLGRHRNRKNRKRCANISI